MRATTVQTTLLLEHSATINIFIQSIFEVWIESVIWGGTVEDVEGSNGNRAGAGVGVGDDEHLSEEEEENKYQAP